MSAKRSHEVTAPLVVVPVDGRDRYLYHGDTVPASVAKTLLDRLIARGLVAPRASKTPASMDDE